MLEKLLLEIDVQTKHFVKIELDCEMFLFEQSEYIF